MGVRNLPCKYFPNSLDFLVSNLGTLMMWMKLGSLRLILVILTHFREYYLENKYKNWLTRPSFCLERVLLLLASIKMDPRPPWCVKNIDPRLDNSSIFVSKKSVKRGAYSQWLYHPNHAWGVFSTLIFFIEIIWSFSSSGIFHGLFIRFWIFSEKNNFWKKKLRI